MNAVRKVTVERNRLRFAAAHMATFRGECEPLHGHNYDIIVELEGELTEDAWVWDFGRLKQATKTIADELDHKFILQRDSKLLDIDERPANWAIRFGDHGYVLPKSDVVALPIPNSTAECLAEWVAGRLRTALSEAGARHLRKLSVGIEEMPGQTGWYTLEL